ncbi:MAG: twin transmembrane helix small protein [Pseudomonadota bacterium]
MLIKIIVILMLLAIVGSLASAMLFLFRDRGRGERTVRALTWRISLSITLFVLLLVGFKLGIIPPLGLRNL